jgi:Uma2 family endonuclease
MGMAAPVYYSAEMVRALPDDGTRYETVHGELLVTPAPSLPHQETVGRLFRALSDYLEKNPVGHAMLSPADISWGPDTLVQPDLFVAPLEEVRAGKWSGIRTLLLAAEVLSPSTARRDRFTKRRLYQEVGVETYWVVDADARMAEVWTPEAQFPQVVTDALAWSPAGAPEPFTLSLERLFRPL